MFDQIYQEDRNDDGKREKSVRISTALKLTEKQILGSIRCWPTFMTILTYLISEQSKKARSF
jgi:hypothetical protein